MITYLKKLFFSLLFLFVIGCATPPPPLPPTLNIVPPDTDVPSEIAAFSGTWEGKWGSSQDTIIVVEKIDTQKADIIVSFGKLMAGAAGTVCEESYRYITASVQPGPLLEWIDETLPNPDTPKIRQCPCKVTFKLNKESDKLTVFWEYIKHNTKERADLTKRK